jgi:hypothetical protein
MTETQPGRSVPFVVFCTPSLGRAFCGEYFMSALATQHLLYTKGWDQIWRMQGGDPYLDKVRNRLVAEALRNFPEMTDLFFIDDDEGWPADAVVRLLERPEDVVAGLYCKKSHKTEFPCELLTGPDGKFIHRDGMVEAALVPTGFLRIKRHVLEKMAADSVVYQDPDSDGNLIDCWNIFQTGIVADPDNPKRGKWWGEDYFFAARWRQMGGSIWVDSDYVITHRGTHVWAANFFDSVRLTEATIDEKARAAS